MNETSTEAPMNVVADDDEAPKIEALLTGKHLRRVINTVNDWKAKQSNTPREQPLIGASKPDADDISCIIGPEEIVLEIQHLRSHFDGLNQIVNQLVQWEGSLCNITQKVESKEAQNVLYVILDTNVLLGDLAMVKSIKKRYAESSSCNSLVFIVPLVVLKELDVLKYDRQQKPYLKSMAVHTFRYVYDLLVNKDTQLRSQTVTKTFNERNEEQTNTDKILDCCLQYKEKNDCQAIIFSNDCVLANKALENSIDVCSRIHIDQFLKKFLPLPYIIHKKKDCNVADECKIVYEAWTATVQHLMCEVVTTELKAVYGNRWQEFLHHKQPWKLKDLLACVKGQWTKVFSNIVKKETSMSLNKLLDKISNISGQPSIQEVEVLLNASDCFLTYFKHRPIYGDHLNKVLGQIGQFKKQINRAKRAAKADDLENSSSSSSESGDCSWPTLESPTSPSREGAAPDFLDNQVAVGPNLLNIGIKSDLEIVKGTFARIWSFINYSCGMILDSLGSDHNVDYVKPPTLPNVRETLSFIERFYPALLDLKAKLMKVLSLPQCAHDCLRIENYSKDTEDDTDYETYIKLCYVLENFMFILRLEPENTLRESITPEMLHKFNLNPKARELMQLGLDQLDYFISLVYERICMQVQLNQDSTESVVKSHV